MPFAPAKSSTPYRGIALGILLCVWLVVQAMAVGHTHDGAQVHADCAVCKLVQVETLPGSSFSSLVAVASRDADAGPVRYVLPRVAPARFFSPRAPPQTLNT